MFTVSWAKYEEYSLERDGAVDAIRDVQRALDFWVRNCIRQSPHGASTDAPKIQEGTPAETKYRKYMSI